MKISVLINGKSLELLEGDITLQTTDAIVNAANSGLRGGGGVDGAIHRAGGPEIMEQCRKIGGCPPGEAVITTGGRLKSRFVIHTVGPIWHGGGKGEPEVLRNAYKNSLFLAEKNDIRSISFPSISTGVYGYPVSQASLMALNTVIEFLKGSSSLELVRFVLFGVDNYSAYEINLDSIMEG
jgi:O-acetyl-ADP-ribose deacetylase (regulator of RNase III)